MMLCVLQRKTFQRKPAAPPEFLRAALKTASVVAKTDSNLFAKLANIVEKLAQKFLKNGPPDSAEGWTNMVDFPLIAVGWRDTRCNQDTTVGSGSAAKSRKTVGGLCTCRIVYTSSV